MGLKQIYIYRYMKNWLMRNVKSWLSQGWGSSPSLFSKTYPTPSYYLTQFMLNSQKTAYRYHQLYFIISLQDFLSFPHDSLLVILLLQYTLSYSSHTILCLINTKLSLISSTSFFVPFFLWILSISTLTLYIVCFLFSNEALQEI